MDIALSHTIGLLGVTILVAMLARRLSLPYTVGLVLTGIGLAVTRLETGAMLTHDFILDVILPPLLYEAAINIHWRSLLRDIFPVLTLSTLGVIVSAAFVAAGMIFLMSWPVMPSLMFGVLIAATDPIAVIALFKDIGVTGRLRLLVESESLFNDGVAAVLFGLTLTWTQLPQGVSLSGIMIALTLTKVAGGGVLVGIACGIVAIAVAWRTSDHLVETALTAVVAYGSFLLAESFHVSGVLATVAAGLLMGNFGVLVDDDEKGTAISSQGREFVVAFWEFRGVHRKFAGVSADRAQGRRNGVRQCRLAGRSCRDCACGGGSSANRLPALPASRMVALGGPNERSAYSVVGRAARRAGAGSSPSAAGVDAVQ